MRTIANLVDNLGDEFDFRIITSDRDLLDTAPYHDIKQYAWTSVGKAQAYYVSPKQCGVLDWIRLLKETPHDILYLNSLFDPRFTLRPLVARLFSGRLSTPVVIAPRGEFSPGALALKRWKKTVFLSLAKMTGLYRNVSWHASTEEEAQFIRQHFGSSAKVSIACNLPAKVPPLNRTEKPGSGSLRIVFLSRISRMKNLDFALRVLAKSKVQIHFDIWGTLEDSVYWGECQDVIDMMPENVSVSYCGVADHNEVTNILSGCDLFFLPTRGENYGHAIAESLSVGTPVLIADTTPWKNLEAEGVGWDLPLQNGEVVFLNKIEEIFSLNVEQRYEQRKNAYQYAVKIFNDPITLEDNRRVFFGKLYLL